MTDRIKLSDGFHIEYEKGTTYHGKCPRKPRHRYVGYLGEFKFDCVASSENEAYENICEKVIEWIKENKCPVRVFNTWEVVDEDDKGL